jgi:hypothetical protein
VFALVVNIDINQHKIVSLFSVAVVKNKCLNQYSVSGESVELYQLRYGKDNQKFLLPFSTKARDISLIQGVNTSFDARSASYSVGTGAFFLEGKVTHLHLAVPHHSDMRL